MFGGGGVRGFVTLCLFLLTGKRRFAVFSFGLGKNFRGRLRAVGDAWSFHANREKALRCFPSGVFRGGALGQNNGFWLPDCFFILMPRKTFDAYVARFPEAFKTATLQKKLLRKFPLSLLQKPSVRTLDPIFPYGTSTPATNGSGAIHSLRVSARREPSLSAAAAAYSVLTGSAGRGGSLRGSSSIFLRTSAIPRSS